MNGKIKSLEGIRAIACICIFICHFLEAFPLISPVEENMETINSAFVDLAALNEFMVRIFFVLGGFVISVKYFQKKQYEQAGYEIVKRWFRFAPSILVINLIACLLMALGNMYNVRASVIAGSQGFFGIYNNFEPGFWLCVQEALVDCLFKGASTYVGPLWTMTYIFYGSILVLAALAICKDNVKLRLVFYAVILSVFSSYYNYFILGMLICDIYCHSEINEYLKKHNKLNNILLVLSFVIAVTTKIDDNDKFIRGAFAVALVIMFLTILNSRVCEKILGNKIIQWCGSISFAIYLVHWPIMESFSSWLYIKLTKINLMLELPVSTLVIGNLIATACFVFVAAYLFHKYVENMGLGAINYIVKKTRSE